MKFFVKAGLGPTIAPRGFNDAFFSLILSGGILIPTQNNLKHLISLDLDFILLSNWFASLKTRHPSFEPFYNLIKSSGTDIAITLNYGLEIPLFFEGTRFIPAVGLGLENTSLNLDINGIKTSDSATAFIILSNLTLRQFITEKVALDFTYKTNLLAAAKGETNSFSTHRFLFSFTYLF